MLHELSSEWLSWLKDNLQRNCNPAELYSILRKNGFSETAIKNGFQIVKGSIPYSVFYKKQIDFSQVTEGMQSEVDYLTLAKRPFLAGNGVNIVENTSDLQLVTVDDFLTPAECQSVINAINTELRPSDISGNKRDKGFRTSETCDLGQLNHAVIPTVERRMSQLIGLAECWSEVTQGQKYSVGQEFKAHTDYFEPGTLEFEQYARIAGQRTWTFMVYLNDTLEGGETWFPVIDVKFKPKAGQAVLWNNLLPSGKPNPSSLHHGQPVIEGEKYIITKWFRDKGNGELFL